MEPIQLNMEQALQIAKSLGDEFRAAYSDADFDIPAARFKMTLLGAISNDCEDDPFVAFPAPAVVIRHAQPLITLIEALAWAQEAEDRVFHHIGGTKYRVNVDSDRPQYWSLPKQQWLDVGDVGALEWGCEYRTSGTWVEIAITPRHLEECK